MTSPSRRRLSFEGLTIDLDAGEIVRDGEAVPVEPQVFDLIVLLASSPGRLVPHEELLEKVWGRRFVSDSTIASRVNAARKALGDDGKAQRIIRTVRGRGFRFELTSRASPFVLSCTPHGYATLMAARGERSDEDWRGGLPRLLEDVAGSGGGSVLASHLASFPTADAAMRAAAALLDATAARCADLLPQRRWSVKVGIADSLESEEAAFSRAGLLAAVAAPGGICATAEAMDALSGDLAVESEPLSGEAWYEPVEAFRVLGIDARALGQAGSGRPAQMAHFAIPEPEEVSVAVLPFQTLGEGRELEEVSVGLRLEVQNALTQLSGVLPIAAGSVAAFAGSTSPDAARALGVRYVLQGTVRARGRDVRLMLELYDRRAGGVTWSRSYDGSLDHGFDFQDRMTARVVRALDVQILSGEQARVWHRSLGNMRAIRLQYQGMRDFFAMTRESMRAAREAFETVHDLCPDVPAGSTWVALCHWFDVQRGWSDDVEASKRAVERWATIAIGMDDADGQAHTALCHVHMMNGRFDEALAIGARATAVRPSCANANGFYAHALYFCGVPERAIHHARLAIRFSPAYPPLFGVVLAGALHEHGDHPGAICVASELARLGARDPLLAIVWCSALVCEDRLAEAGCIARALEAAHPGLDVTGFLGMLPFRDARAPRRLAQSVARATSAAEPGSARRERRGAARARRPPGAAGAHRELTAIVLGDVAAYSRLTGRAELATHEEVMAVLDHFGDSVRSRGGAVLRHAGDSILARFPSVTDAVSCCVDIQRELSQRAAQRGESEQVSLRIGVNLGEVLVDRGEIFGGGVNLAARLEAAAPPGGICITSTVHDAIRGYVDATFRDGGEVQFKNFDRLVHVFHWTPGA